MVHAPLCLYSPQSQCEAVSRRNGSSPNTILLDDRGDLIQNVMELLNVHSKILKKLVRICHETRPEVNKFTLSCAIFTDRMNVKPPRVVQKQMVVQHGSPAPPTPPQKDQTDQKMPICIHS